MKNLEKIALLQEEYSNAEKTEHLKLLKGNFKFIQMLAQANTLKAASKSLLIAFTIAFEGITDKENKAHLFSKDWEKLIDKVSRGLQKVAFPEQGEAEVELLKVMLMGILTTSLGLLWTAQEYKKTMDDEVIRDSKSLLPELLLRAIIQGEVVKTLFDELSLALVADNETVSSSLESLFLLLALLAFSREGGEDDSELLYGIKEPLLKNINLFEEKIQKALYQERVTQEEIRMAETFIKQIKLAIAQSHFEPLFKTTQEVLKSLGITLSEIMQDIQTIKRVSLSLSQHMGDAKTQVTHVTFVG